MMKLKTNELVVAALLAALSMVIPFIMPRLDLGPFSATLASHVPLFVGMFISPAVAVAAGIGSALGFLIKAPIYIFARASMHILVGLLGAVLISRKWNIWAVGILTLVAHAVLETISVIPFLSLVPPVPGMTWYEVILIGTSIHHVIDFVLAYILVRALRHARVLPIG